MSENDDLREYLLKEIADIRSKITPEITKRLKLDLTEKIVHRLSSFSNGCIECQNYMHSLEVNLKDIKEVVFQKEQNLLKGYFTNLKSITMHLQKKHKFVTEGYYTNIYMSMGVALGLPFGTSFSLLLDNLAFTGIGLPIGLIIGLSIGAALDKKAKKDRRVI